MCGWVLCTISLLARTCYHNDSTVQRIGIYLKEVLPELLYNVPVAVRNAMWFQYDEDPTHFSINVRNYFDATFGVRWIGRGVPVAWPLTDLLIIDFYL